MMDIIREGGWPMYPVLGLGLMALLLALRYALFPERHQLTLIAGLTVAAVVMGGLGTALGVMQSARSIGDVPDHMKWIFLVGLRESLNNLASALALALPATLLATVGKHRLARRLDAIKS